uniref:Uncharacterized protein n=1 Tax=Vombatus ursinus TaxID=29139 RepID=A0A4X2M1J3_VOMUR
MKAKSKNYHPQAITKMAQKWHQERDTSLKGVDPKFLRNVHFVKKHKKGLERTQVNNTNAIQATAEAIKATKAKFLKPKIPNGKNQHTSPKMATKHPDPRVGTKCPGPRIAASDFDVARTTDPNIAKTTDTKVTKSDSKVTKPNEHKAAMPTNPKPVESTDPKGDQTQRCRA